MNDYVAWLNSKLIDLTDLINPFNKLLDNQDAFGSPGQSGNPEKIARIGIRVGELYANAIAFVSVVSAHHCDCSQYYPECLRDDLNAIFVKARDYLIVEGSAVVRFYEGYGPEVLRRIQDATSRAQPGETLKLDLSMNYEFGDFGFSGDVDSFISRMRDA